MSFQHTNDYLLGYKPTVFPAGAEVVSVRYAIDLTTSDLDLNDVGAVGILPAGCIPVGLTLDADDLDAHATPTLATTVGLLNASQSDIQVSFASGVTLGQTAAAMGCYFPATGPGACHTPTHVPLPPYPLLSMPLYLLFHPGPPVGAV